MCAADEEGKAAAPARAGQPYAALFDPPNYNEAAVKKSAAVERLEQRIEVRLFIGS